MPPKRGKRGRAKKVVKPVEGDDDSAKVDVSPSIEETESTEESALDTSSSVIADDVIDISEDKEDDDKRGYQTTVGDAFDEVIAVEGVEGKDEDLGSEEAECYNVAADLDNMESMEDNYENMESMEENIENMESMDNDEALDFKDLGIPEPPNQYVMEKIDDNVPVSSKGGGSAQYDPSMEDIDSPPEQSPKHEYSENMESESSLIRDAKREVGLEVETETVSEDELPTETTKPPSDTEAVSDEELPPTNSSDHLLDTEAVSEDELPPVKKRKRDDSPGKEKIVKSDSKTITSDKRSSRKSSDQSLDTEAVSEDELPPVRKRKAESENDRDKKSDSVEMESKSHKRPSSVGEASDSSSSKKSSESKSSKALLELEKYWKAVKEDPADFTGWTYLLQYVDQGQDVEAAREAYDAFLSHYPYCYGYWRKYADYEKKKGDKSKSQDVFERGLAAIPLSVDLWLHYLNHIKSAYKDDDNYVRQQYDRALEVCGIEFRSDRLWDSYIKWETECKNISNVFCIYDKLLSIPTQGYKGHFENFVDFVKANQPNKMLSVDEFLSIRAEVLQKLKQKGSSETGSAANAPPGDDSDEETEKSPNFADEETKLMRDKIITLRTKSFKAMSIAVLDRWNYEEGIKRPYFHVKPLERCQLNNWRSYLDYEIAQGDNKRTVVLFERCLIACALYDEFWIKYVRYLESLSGDDINVKIRDVYERACTIHHPKKPMLSLNWASFEENHGCVSEAREILIRLEKEVPNSLQISICRINLERRANNLEEVAKLYEHYIANNKNKFATNALSIKYARFCQKILNDIDKGSEVLKKAIEKDKDNPRLYHQLFDLLFSRTPRGSEHEEECVNVINQFLDRDSTDLEHKLLFAQHKVEFLEDFGSNMSTVQKAVSDYMNLLKQVKDKRRKQYEDKVKTEDKKIKSGEVTPSHTTSSAPPNGNSSATSGTYSSSFPSGPVQQPSYQNSSNQYQQPSNYGQPPYNQYNNQSDPNYNNYQNWNYQQTPGYNNYNQGWGSYNYY